MELVQKQWAHPSVKRLLKQTHMDDPLMAIRQKAQALVSTAYELGWNGPPFNPVSLAKLLNIAVLPNDSILDARIVPIDNDNLQIEYNPQQRLSRINFSISHELGHTLFPDCADAIRNRVPKKSPADWELEFLCDVAASEILLPYSVFASSVETCETSLTTMLDLAEQYKASLEAVFLRYAEVETRPCAILISTATDKSIGQLHVDYAACSSAWAPLFTSGIAIPRTSSAYECTAPGWTSHKTTENWGAFGGQQFHSQSIGLSPLRKTGMPRVGTVLVPADEHSDVERNSIDYVLGDATQPRGRGPCIIAQVVNTVAGLGTGFGKAMATAWPETARALREWKRDDATFRLGECQRLQIGEDTYAFQMLAQEGLAPRVGVATLRYTSLRRCLSALSEFAQELGATVHMPRIGAGQANGRWDIIEGMIREELIVRGISVTIYDLPGTRMARNTLTQPSLFESQ